MNTAVELMPINIYKVTNLVNGKVYIGQTNSTAAKRFAQHWYDASVCKKQNPFHKALRKHGKENFSHELILVCEGHMANYYENEVMRIFNSHVSRGNGYNVANPLDHFRSIQSAKGELHGNAILTDAQVLEIRSRIDLSHSDAAKLFNIGYATVKNIRRGASWMHIGGLRNLSEYKHDKKRGASHHNSVISDDVRNIIKNDKETNSTLLAKKYGISAALVKSIRGPQLHIRKLGTISNETAQYVLDHPEVANSVLSKKLGISAATISRIKTGKQFNHLISNATAEQWSIFYAKQKKATGNTLKGLN